MISENPSKGKEPQEDQFQKNQKSIKFGRQLVEKKKSFLNRYKAIIDLKELELQSIKKQKAKEYHFLRYSHLFLSLQKSINLNKSRSKLFDVKEETRKYAVATND